MSRYPEHHPIPDEPASEVYPRARSAFWACYLAGVLFFGWFGTAAIMEGLDHSRHIAAAESENFSAFRTANGGVGQ